MNKDIKLSAGDIVQVTNVNSAFYGEQGKIVGTSPFHIPGIARKKDSCWWSVELELRRKPIEFSGKELALVKDR